MEIKVSKYLYVQKMAEGYIITNEITGKRVACQEDLIQLLGRLQRESILIDEDLQEALLKAGMLIESNEEQTNEEDFLKKWCNLCQKQIFESIDEIIIIRYGASKEDCIDDMIKRIKYLYRQIRNILPQICNDSRFILRCCILNNDEYKQVIKENHLGEQTRAFVNNKCILILNEITDEGIIIHELMHLLIGEKRINIPFWLEEGVCELYRMKITCSDNRSYLELRGNINFVDLQEKRYASIGEMNRHEIVPNYFYDVCSRFAYFILEALGEKKFWSMLQKIDLTLDIDGLLFEYTKRSLGQWCEILCK